MRRVLVAAVAAMLFGLPAFGESFAEPKGDTNRIILSAGPMSVPAAGDKCPVCGMFVAKYPDWFAMVQFKDGSRAWFDGPKDMFKFVFEAGEYLPGKSAGDIASLEVTEYYGLTRIDARGAYFVTGSDVHGPMGKELVPFKNRQEAEEFARDHRGKAVLTFDEITKETIGGL